MTGAGRVSTRRLPPMKGLAPAVQDLINLQERARLTDKALSDKAGYSKGVIGHWRPGRPPALPTLMEYAQVFGYEVRLVPIIDPGPPIKA